MVMTLDEVIKTIEGLNRKNGAFCGFETITTPKLTKKNRTTKEPTTFSVVIHSTFSAMLGVNYENAVNNKKEKLGEERDFIAQKANGKHYVEGSKYLMQSDNNPDKFYIALDKVGGVKRKYLIDGREATEEEIEDLKKNYLPTSKPHPYGITWRTYGIEGIIKIK
jgi:DNA polymerase II large subunit